MLRFVTVLLALGSAIVLPRGSGTSLDHANDGQAQSQSTLDARRRQLQERNREALTRLRSLLSDHLSQSPATPTPYPPRAAARRRQLISPARPAYATQCLYEPPPPAPPDQLQDDDGAASQRRRAAQESDGGLSAGPAADSPVSMGGRCYLNPMVLAHPDFPEPESPIETMLLKSAWTAYQCSFEKSKGRCGTYRHPPYDCRWQEDQGRCAVTSDYLLPRLLAYLHCRDDATLTPFWDRCYTVGVLTNDKDWCGQPDGNWARCWWFPARDESEVDICAPSPGGGVESKEVYDELVAQMRSGVWLQEWFGSCPTAELVFTIKSACNWTAPGDCAADPVCRLRPDLPIEYGMCQLRDELIWGALFGSGSALFNATAAAIVECEAASDSVESCMAAGSLAPEPGGEVPLEPDRYADVIDLVFIEEVTPGGGAAPAGGRPRVALLLAAAGLLVLTLQLLLLPSAAAM